MRTSQEASFEADYWLAMLDVLEAINSLVMDTATDVAGSRSNAALDKLIEIQDALKRLIQLAGGRVRVISTEADQWRR